MNILKLIWIYLCLLLLSSCHYSKDKLKIKNSSKEDIIVHTLTKDKIDNSYYEISGGCYVGVDKTESPIIRNSIESSIESDKSDHFIYIVFCRPNEIDYVVKNENIIIQDKRFVHLKLNIKQLDSLDWFIEFKKNQ